MTNGQMAELAEHLQGCLDLARMYDWADVHPILTIAEAEHVRDLMFALASLPMTALLSTPDHTSQA